ncbi:hypothetical protein AKJ37_03460 [candidate division MSBL1 archaeon SCGC-AAA259I09]|uniref:Cell division protein SepF n=2 Tax=candidate division MSBL1 TaxID=215777 RepID=A0A133USU9_9EURY|nr:hypothetical protein AKJ37_03460 [candidate division MSBL1 archaeon SCGC-AAA259I09]KXA98266.1 hypothetical protein AKJ39_02355 [candidate division MSBL1 archaeon SCGC-AAA259J03]
MKKIFGREKIEPPSGEEGPSVPVEEFSETEAREAEGEPPGLVEPIRVMRRELTPSIGVDDLVDTVQGGDIVILDMAPLMDEDPQALRDSIDRLKRKIRGFGGNMARLTDSLILIVPMLVDIEFRRRRPGGE